MAAITKRAFQYGVSGVTSLRANYRDAQGLWYHTNGTPGVEAYNGANVANYAAATGVEIGNTGVYEFTRPAPVTGSFPANDYTTIITDIAGASQTEADIENAVGFGEDNWDGTTLAPYTAPTAVQNRIEMDDNSVMLDAITANVGALPLGIDIHLSNTHGDGSWEGGSGGGLTEEQAAQLASIDAKVQTGIINVVSPVSIDGTTISLVQGDDYTDDFDPSREIEIVVQNCPVLPDGTTCTLTIAEKRTGTAQTSVTGTIGSRTGSDQTLLFSLPSTESEKLTVGGGQASKFDIDIVLPTNEIATQVHGVVNVTARVARPAP